MGARPIAAALAAIILFAAAPAFAANLAPITVGYSPTVDFVPLFVAQDQGLFSKRGLEVALVSIPVAANDPPASPRTASISASAPCRRCCSQPKTASIS